MMYLLTVLQRSLVAMLRTDWRKERADSKVEGCYTFQASHDGNSQGDYSRGGEKWLDYG